MVLSSPVGWKRIERPASGGTITNYACRRFSLVGLGLRITTGHLHRVKYIYMSETSDVSSSRYYVYILYSLHDKGFYIGFTTNLKIRLIKHSKGEVTATKSRRPLKLIHYEYFIDEEDAKAREEFLKSGYGRKSLKEMLKRTMRKFEP